MGAPSRKIPYKVIEDTMKDLRMSVERFAVEARISPSGVYNWKREGEAPAYVALICEALRARHEDARAGQVTTLLQIPPEAEETIANFASKIGGQLARAKLQGKTLPLLYTGEPDEVEVLESFVKQLGGDATSTS